MITSVMWCVNLIYVYIHNMSRRSSVRMLDKRLERIFTNPRVGGSFGGLDTLWRAVNKDGNSKYVSRYKVSKWLQKKRSYTLHRQPKRRFQRRKVVVSGINDQWQADLVDMTNLATFNDKHTFILTVIDVFSKIGYARASRNKEGRSIVNAFKDILRNNGGKKPISIQTDKGKNSVINLYKNGRRWKALNCSLVRMIR